MRNNKTEKFHLNFYHNFETKKYQVKKSKYNIWFENQHNFLCFKRFSQYIEKLKYINMHFKKIKNEIIKWLK